MIDATGASREEQELLHEVMGIGIAVRGIVGETRFFERIDAAINAMDIAAMHRIKAAYNRLSAGRQSALVAGLADHEELVGIVEALEAIHERILAAERDRRTA